MTNQEQLESDDEQDEYHHGYTHEAMHTVYVLMDTFENHILATRCADRFKDVAEAAERAHQAMFDLYQLIGEKFDEPTEDLEGTSQTCN